MSILALNAGSTSLKFGLFADTSYERLVTGEINWVGGDRQRAELTVQPKSGPLVQSRLRVEDDASAAVWAIQIAADLTMFENGSRPEITAVGHRVVHGGAEFRASALIDDRVKTAIAQFADLAPLHNPPALKAIETAEAALPGIPQVAVFDTAFFVNLPPHAFLYPLPYEWYHKWGIRRFGFHGLSHAYCANRAAQLAGRKPTQLRVITLHLGGGCSAVATQGGVPIATTGGFSPLDGLMMGTRSGAIDPGILLHLERRHGVTGRELDRALNHASGLLGVSGLSADLAQIEHAASLGNQRARLAFDLFAGQIRKCIGSLAASLGGVDVLTFTDRIGEGSPALRAAACNGLQFMGIRIDSDKNAAACGDMDIAASHSSARILVIHTNEDLMVARETERAVASVDTSPKPSPGFIHLKAHEISHPKKSRRTAPIQIAEAPQTR